MQAKEIAGGMQINLSPNLDLNAAEELHGLLIQATAQPEVTKLELLGQDVDRVSTAAIQIILSVARGFESSSKELILSNPSEKLQAAFELLGLKSELSKIN